MTFNCPTTDHFKTFWEKGFLGPLKGLSEDAANQAYDEIRGRRQELKGFPALRNRHLDWPLIARLCLNDEVVRSAQSILGADLILWRSMLFVGGTDLTWHRDVYSNLMIPAHGLSAQMAVSMIDASNGVYLLPGSHCLTESEIADRWKLKPLSSNEAYGNSRFKSRHVPDGAVLMTLAPGEFYIFHGHTVHCSAGAFAKASKASQERLALSMRIARTETKILPHAYSEELPRINRPALLSGSDHVGLNVYAPLAVARS